MLGNRTLTGRLSAIPPTIRIARLNILNFSSIWMWVVNIVLRPSSPQPKHHTIKSTRWILLMEMKSEKPPIWESNLKRLICSLLQLSVADIMTLIQSRWYWNEDGRKIPTEKHSTIGRLLVPAEVTCLRQSRFQSYELDFTAARCGWQCGLVMRLYEQYSTVVLQSTGDQLDSVFTSRLR